MTRLDLHMHSKYSIDGEYEPIQLLEMGKQAGLDMMAIADHNSVRGSRIALAHQKEIGIACIPAIEIDAVSQGVGYHILGYGIDVHHPVFDEIEENVVTQERIASRKRMELVRNMGIAFDDARIQELSVVEGIVTGEMIAEAAMDYDKEHQNPWLQPYYPGKERGDNPYVNFYWDICAPGKPAYVEVVYPSVADIVKLLHEQKALAIVAHPGMNAKEKEERIQDLLALGVDGFEVFSSYHTPQQTRYYYDIAKQHGLYMTCGSDFHGKTKPSVSIGMCTMEEEAAVTLTNTLQKWIGS